MKRKISILLASALCLSMFAALISCDTDEQTKEPGTETEIKTEAPTATPTETPTQTVTEAPTQEATNTETQATNEDKTEGSDEQATQATTEPETATVTEQETQTTTEAATFEETVITTEAPTEKPTEKPTEAPTEAPTEKPTEKPTEAPTEKPTEKPTEAPTEKPTETPTEAPTEKPTEKPTEAPTEAPTEKPTEKPTEAPTEKPTETPTEESTESPTEDLAGKTTVSESEWEELFSAVNVRIEYGSDSLYQCYEYDGDLIRIYMEMSRGDSTERYETIVEYISETGECWMHEEAFFEGNWIKELVTIATFESAIESREVYFNSLADDYDVFRYDDETKTYIADTVKLNYRGQEMPLSNVRVKIEDGKISEILLDFNGGTIVMSNIGAVKVEIPTVDCTVTEERWEEIWQGDEFINVDVHKLDAYEKIEYGIYSGEARVVMSLLYSENAIAVDYATMLVKKDGVWYELQKGEYGYTGTARDEEYVYQYYSIAGSFGSVFAGAYSSFEYDAENECYVGEVDGAEYSLYFRSGKLAFIETEDEDAVDGKSAYMFRYYGEVRDEEFDIPEFTVVPSDVTTEENPEE